MLGIQCKCGRGEQIASQDQCSDCSRESYERRNAEKIECERCLEKKHPKHFEDIKTEGTHTVKQAICKTCNEELQKPKQTALAHSENHSKCYEPVPNQPVGKCCKCGGDIFNAPPMTVELGLNLVCHNCQDEKQGLDHRVIPSEWDVMRSKGRAVA